MYCGRNRCQPAVAVTLGYHPPPCATGVSTGAASSPDFVEI